MKIQLKDRREIAKGVLLIKFDTLGKSINFEPGQFFTLTLINPPFTDERGNYRIFGFVNSPLQKDIEILTKIGPSAFKKSLQEIPIGTEVEINGINGRIDLPKDINQQLIFITKGVGIAPIISIIRLHKEKRLLYQITLIYINNDQQSAPFFNELENYAKENLKFKFIPAQTLNNSLIASSTQYLDTNLYFVKGEQSFVMPAIKILKELGVKNNNISMEIFTGY